MDNTDHFVKFWGVRGSIPTPISPASLEDKIVDLLTGLNGRSFSSREVAQAYLKSQPLFERTTVGGNTACLEVRAQGQHIIIDCGSGMKELGWSLMREAYGRGQGEAHILISHTHWDHIMGFPFFTPAYIPGNRFTICGVHKHLKQRFKRQHHAHNFPVPMDVMGADIQFKKLALGRKQHIGNLTLEAIQLSHPGDAYAYRIQFDNRIFVYASDSAYENPSPEAMAQYHAFYRNADILVFDAHFDLIESFEKIDWGHSTSFLGVDIALHAGVKHLILFHHDPRSDDHRLSRFLDGTRRYLNHVAPESSLKVDIAYEGLTLPL